MSLRIKDWLQEQFDSISLRAKLTLSFLVLIIVPVVLLSFFTYSNIHRTVLEQTGSAYLEALKQSEINISYGLGIAGSIAELAQSSPDLQRIMRTVYERPLTLEEELTYFIALQNLIKSYETNRNVLNVNLYMRAGPGFIGGNPDYRDMELLKQEPSFAKVVDRTARKTWVYGGALETIQPSSMESLVLLHEIRSLSNVGQVIGYVMIELDLTFVWNIVERLSVPEGAYVLLTDNGKPLQRQRDPGRHQEAVRYYLQRSADRQEGISTFQLSGASYYAVTNIVDEVHWELSLLMTEEHMAANSASVRQFIVVMSFCVTVLAISTALYVSGNITRRLKRLIGYIKKAEMGSFEVDPDVRGKDEYAILQLNFNQMSSTIKELIEQVYQAKLSKQDAEMKLLYAQINPHFVYNTLDIIHWHALRLKSREIAEVTESLATFLRLSLNGGREMISVSDELHEIESYMKIINYRYRAAIALIIDIPEKAKEQHIIKMVLQPLVENAIVHGIRSKPSKTGTIIIKARLEQKELIFQVIDDGVGMTRERMAGLLESTSSGYGVRNVDQRIKVHYGEQYGLQYYSAPGIGCSVVVRMRVTELE